MARTNEKINNITVSEIPDSIQKRFEYNDNGTVLYAGYAAKGISAAADDWTLHKFTYTDSRMTLKQTAYGSWDGRAGYTYD